MRRRSRTRCQHPSTGSTSSAPSSPACRPCMRRRPREWLARTREVIPATAVLGDPQAAGGRDFGKCPLHVGKHTEFVLRPAAVDSGYGDPPRVLDIRVERHMILVSGLHLAKRAHEIRWRTAANPDLNAVAARKVLRFLFAEARNVKARSRKSKPSSLGAGSTSRSATLPFSRYRRWSVSSDRDCPTIRRRLTDASRIPSSAGSARFRSPTRRGRRPCPELSVSSLSNGRRIRPRSLSPLRIDQNRLATASVRMSRRPVARASRMGSGTLWLSYLALRP